MDSRNASRGLLPWLAMVMLVFGLVKGDINKDKEQCAEQLVGLATCLPYVGGQAKAPSVDCCNGLKLVLQKSKVCLCILIKDRNDPSLGLKINATLALTLPTTCHTPADISQCPSLMNLPPNSPDAKVFDDFAKSAQKSNSTTTTPSGDDATKGKAGGGSSAAEVKSDGGWGRKWLGVEKVWGLLLMIVMVSHFHIPT